MLKNKELEKYIRNNYKTMTYKEIAKQFANISHRTVEYYVSQMGLKKGSGYHRDIADKYKMNNHYFDSINSNVAYILGFIAADGHIDINRRNRVIVALNQKDKYILEFIKSEICPLNPIRYIEKTNAVSLEFGGRYIVNKIIELGVDPKKININTLDIIPQEYVGDFIRGVFDGDGCLSLRYRKRIIKLKNKDKEYESIEPKFSIVNMSTKLLYDIQNILKTNSIKPDKNTKAYCLSTCNINKLKYIYNIMYKNHGFSLLRKTCKFKELFVYKGIII